jgi:uncharacterized membrane protein YhdT
LASSDEKKSLRDRLRRLYTKVVHSFSEVNTLDPDASNSTPDLEQISKTRSPVAVGLAAILLTMIATFMVVIGWQREYLSNFLASNSFIKTLDHRSQDWYVSSIKKSDCSDQSDCLQKLNIKGLQRVDFDSLLAPWKDLERNDVSETEPIYILLKTEINRSTWKSLYDSGYKNLMVGMPSGRYDNAKAFVNDQLMGAFTRSSRMGFPVLLEEEPDSIIVSVLYLKSWHYTGLFEDDEEPLLITTPADYRAWVRVLVKQSAHQGNWVSHLSFIVMAAFFLLLYLFVDSSPEVLGLALFVGLDAFGRSLIYEWLPVPFTPQISDTADSASQILRLYFLLQLSRVGFSKIGPWLILAFVYSGFATAGSWLKALGMPPVFEDRVYEINVWCGLIVAFIGILVSVVSGYRIRGFNQPWRQWALGIAVLACVLQVVAYLNNVLPELGNYPEFFKIRSVIIPLSVFLLASSAFVNISTLENRVKVLSSAKAKHDEIKKELELGRVVQNAYMKIPNLPPEIDMACHFEAAFYVSGDAYFVHWDPETERLAVILGDMTGHGVHAALKATTLQVIARTIFRDPMRRSGPLGERFIVYEQALRSFLRDSWAQGDLPTFLGIELDFISGSVVSHRANFPFPMIVVQAQDGSWDVRVWSDVMGELNAKTFGVNLFFVSATDGVVGGSKMFNRIAARLKRHLNDASHVNSEVIKQSILVGLEDSGDKIDDDRTMVVFGLKNPSKVA